MDFKQFDAVIDARTPAEYALDHVPGALSAPVLYDAERVEVGTLYKQVSQFEARKRGAAMIARNVAAHIEKSFQKNPTSWRPLVYCWRGGKRSWAMAHLLREVGWPAETLPGGSTSRRSPRTAAPCSAAFRGSRSRRRSGSRARSCTVFCLSRGMFSSKGNRRKSAIFRFPRL